jgi:hypothetical protein
MAVLVAPKTWRREPKGARARLSPDRLSTEESANVRKALLFLRTRHGGTEKLADALGVRSKMLAAMLSKAGKPGAGLALRAARAAGVPPEMILLGTWPREGSCPHCGRE